MAALAGNDERCGESTILTVKLESVHRAYNAHYTTEMKFLGFTMTLMCSSVPYLDLVEAVLTDTSNTLHYQYEGKDKKPASHSIPLNFEKDAACPAIRRFVHEFPKEVQRTEKWDNRGQQLEPKQPNFDRFIATVLLPTLARVRSLGWTMTPGDGWTFYFQK